MNSETEDLLLMLLVVCAKQAARIPTRTEPAESAWEQAADEYCLRFARTSEAEMPSPEVAAAMIPRLRIARLFATHTASALSARGKYGGGEATERDLLELLLVELWREVWRKRWLAGEWE